MSSDHKIMRITVQNAQNDIARIEKNMESLKSELELKIKSNDEVLKLTAKQF